MKKPTVNDLKHASFVTIRTHQDGTLDEVIANGVDLHIEQLNANQWWLGIEKDGKRQRVVFYTDRAHIAAITEYDGE